MLIVEKFLSCDGGPGGEVAGGCLGEYGVDMRDKSGSQHRADAKAEGWHTNGTQDFCPVCWKANKKVKQ